MFTRRWRRSRCCRSRCSSSRAPRSAARAPGRTSTRQSVDAPHPRRARDCKRVRLRAVRRHGGIFARHLFGHRLGRDSRNAQARLFGGLRLRHHCSRRDAGHPAAAIDNDDPLRGRSRAVARPALSRSHRPCPAALPHTRSGAIGASTATPWRCIKRAALIRSCSAKAR